MKLWKKRLEEIREREKLASKGPWLAFSGGGFISIGVKNPCEIAEKVPGSVVSEESKKTPNARNYTFIAHARQDLPLMTEVAERAVQLLVSLAQKHGLGPCVCDQHKAVEEFVAALSKRLAKEGVA